VLEALALVVVFSRVRFCCCWRWDGETSCN